METEICDSLIKWLDVLNLSSPHSTVEELSDGVALSEALSKIAPEAFDEAWLSKIKRDVGTNWRLKVSNLKKIIEGIFIYFMDVLNLTSTISEDLRPDPMKIAEKCDVFELARLLQLVLGCAVNCLEKQKYITEIMELEEALQRNIMTALQDIEYLWQDSNNGLASRSSIIVSNAVEVKTVLADDREILAQKCHETNKKMLLLIEEKSSMQQEINRLQGQLDKYENPILIGEDCKSIGPIQLGSSRYNDLRKIVEGLKDELLQTETARDDYKMKSMLQEKEIIELQSKMDELHRITIENGQLKDEIDILKEANDKLKIYETQIITFKKKLEDYNDLKKQIKLLEDRNSDYLKQNMQFDDEMKKYCILKGQVDLYKKEIQDLHTKLDNEMSKNIKVEFELNQLQSKVNVTQREKENLIVEIDSLKDLIDELKCGSGNTGAGNTMSKELQSSDLLDRIDRLERENKCLRENQGGQTALSQLLDDSNKREEKLREQLKYANQKVLLLSQNENNNKGENDEQLKPELNEQKSAQLEELISSLHSKISTLESSLMAKENDYIALDNRYKKCVEKAKEVIKTFDPKAITEAIMTDKQDIEIEPSMTVLEERLLATAFYKMGLNLQRDAVDTRLSLAGNAQSFLGRQRQAASRKPSAANFIKK